MSHCMSYRRVGGRRVRLLVISMTGLVSACVGPAVNVVTEPPKIFAPLNFDESLSGTLQRDEIVPRPMDAFARSIDASDLPIKLQCLLDLDRKGADMRLEIQNSKVKQVPECEREQRGDLKQILKCQLTEPTKYYVTVSLAPAAQKVSYKLECSAWNVSGTRTLNRQTESTATDVVIPSIATSSPAPSISRKAAASPARVKHRPRGSEALRNPVEAFLGPPVEPRPKVTDRQPAPAPAPVPARPPALAPVASGGKSVATKVYNASRDGEDWLLTVGDCGHRRVGASGRLEPDGGSFRVQESGDESCVLFVTDRTSRISSGAELKLQFSR